MDIETLKSFEWGMMAPEFIIFGAAALLSLLDLFLPKKTNRNIIGGLSVVAVMLAFVALLQTFGGEPTSILYDTFYLDGFAKAFKLLLLIGTAFVLLLALGSKKEDGLETYGGEFYYLMLTALLGAMFLTSSADLITLFVGLELLSIASYILVGMKKRNKRSNESAMKYVINGGIASAILLFGLSYVYGLSGTTNLREMGQTLPYMADTSYVYLLGIAFLMVLVGVAFKIASIPFHMWAPDVYEGAPTPVAAFLSVVSKTAGFVLLIRLALSIFTAARSSGETGVVLLDGQTYIGVIAAITMIVGNLIAIRQRSVKRMLAYSSIGHAGYILVAFTSLSQFMFEAIWFYLFAYIFMTIGAFAVLQMVSETSQSEDISSFAGLYKKAPALAVAMGIFLLSLAGIPGTAGFIGKLHILASAFVTAPGHIILGSIMIITTVISYVYYFGIMIQMFFRPAGGGAANAGVGINIPVGPAVVVIVCAVATVFYGVVPGTAMEFFQFNFDGFTDFLQ
ncbi:NADH-quinone oxidoreductase subunit NuoN [Bacillus carboniphilus]|uniref:NADH-quinone oxidoreductase subunit N n=1 Tax=Bacillus carboniphilus TaxID=86663 RepID=A0ABN0VXF3_9BACI